MKGMAKPQLESHLARDKISPRENAKRKIDLQKIRAQKFTSVRMDKT